MGQSGRIRSIEPAFGGADKRFSGGTIWIILQLYEVLPGKLPANPEPVDWIARPRSIGAPTFSSF
ncbi:hypothetical protein G3M48_002604, partial [Beauveria asiatica]